MIDFTQPTLYISLFTIALCPTFWNILCRNEYRNHTLTRLFGSKQLACSLFGVACFCLGLIRDLLFTVALHHQPQNIDLVGPGFILFVCGGILTVSSMLRLGMHGTYMGDYFGIHFSEKLSGFPFNILDNPMYVGSTMTFLGTSLLYGRAAGVFLSCWVYFCYWIAGILEQPFTDMIYQNLE